MALLFVPPSNTTIRDTWWGMTIAGRPVGYCHETVARIASGDVSTVVETRLSIGRLSAKVEMFTKTTCLENNAGAWISCLSQVKLSKQESLTTARVKAGQVVVTTVSGGRSYDNSTPVTGKVFGPYAVEQATARLRKTGDTFSMPVFSPFSNKVANETLTVVGSDGGKLQEKDVIEGQAAYQRILADSSGRVLQRSQDLPFGELKLLPSSAALAQAMARGGQMPADVYGQVIARSNVRLPDPRSIDSITLELTTSRPEKGWPTLSTENQHVLSQSPEKTVLEIDRSKAPGTGIAAAVPDPDTLQPNALVQSDDPSILALVHQLRNGAKDPYAIARRQQDWLARHAKFDAGIVLAPASETIKSHAGTCIAFAILLAAMERAAGIPSRVAEGFVYEQGMWGGHAWTEVWIGGKWIPLDAAMYSPGPADAARFCFVRSSLKDGGEDLSDAAWKLYGNLKVRTLEYRLHGTVVKLGDAASYTVQGNLYTNSTLGISLHKPSDATFTELDRVYPDATVVGLRFPKGMVRISTYSGGPSAAVGVVSRRGMASETWRVGNAIWEIDATGHDARRLLADTRVALKI